MEYANRKGPHLSSFMITVVLSVASRVDRTKDSRGSGDVLAIEMIDHNHVVGLSKFGHGFSKGFRSSVLFTGPFRHDYVVII